MRLRQIRLRLLSRAISLVPGSLRGVVRRVPGVAAAQRAAVAALGQNEEFDHLVDYGPAKGLRLPIRLPQDKAFWKGTYEEGFCARLAAAVSAGDVCCDIGAFRGYTAGVMALAGASRVCAFEPAPLNRQAVRRVIAMNPDLPIRLVEAAVGAEEGTIKITIHEDASMNFVGEDASGRPVVEVDVHTIDNMVASGKLESPQLLKIDVEGAEALVLEGAANALRNSVRQIFVELHHDEARQECERLLAEARFERIWQAEDEGVFPMQTQFRKRY
jgi:FkbM family methyltransferase